MDQLLSVEHQAKYTAAFQFFIDSDFCHNYLHILKHVNYYDKNCYIEKRATCIKRLFWPPMRQNYEIRFSPFFYISLSEQCVKCIGLILV